MVQLTSETIWSWAFPCWEVFDYWFNHLTLLCSDFLLMHHRKKLILSHMFLGIYVFLHWCIILHIDLLESFVILCISCDISSFISDFIYLFLFFLLFGVNLAKGLSILFILSKKPALSFVDLSYYFCALSFIYVLILFLSFC